MPVAVALVALSLRLLRPDLGALEACWTISCALGLAVAGATARTSWQAAGAASAALLVGAASQLALTVPDWFQPIALRAGSARNNVFLLGLAFQVAVSILVLVRGRTAGVRLPRLRISPRAVLLVCAVLASGFSAFDHVRRGDPTSLAYQFVFAAAFWAANAITVVALFVSLPAAEVARLKQAALRRVSLTDEPAPGGAVDRWWPYVTAAWVLGVSVLLCWVAFQRIPHLEDEVVYLFQAKTLLAGHVSVPAPETGEAFRHYLIDTLDGRWFAITSPGWAAMLVPGVALNLAWLVNPVLAALTVLLAHALLRRLAGRGTANVTVALLALSPWFLAVSASFMNHAATVAVTLASWLALSHARSRRSAWLALLSGALMGLLFLIRPLDGLLVGLVTGLWSLAFLRGPRGALPVVAYGLGCIAVGALIFPFNEAITGDYLTTPLNHYIDRVWHPGANRLGFGADIGAPGQWGRIDLYPGHGPFEALVNLQHNTYMLHFELFGWGIGSLLLVFVHALWGRWTRLEAYAAAFILLIVGTYSLYWFNGSFFIGPRYWYLALSPLVLLSAAGLRTLAQRMAGDGARIGVVLAVLGLAGMACFLPWRGTMKYFEYRGYHADYREMRRRLADQPSLVFIRDTSKPDYGSAFALNEPVLSDSPVIFAIDLGPEVNRAVARAYPGRSIYLAQGRGRDVRRAHISAGPLSVDAMAPPAASGRSPAPASGPARRR